MWSIIFHTHVINNRNHIISVFIILIAKVIFFTTKDMQLLFIIIRIYHYDFFFFIQYLHDSDCLLFHLLFFYLTIFRERLSSEMF